MLNSNTDSFKSFIFCDPGETRTLGPLIKSQLLYQLSYGVFDLYFFDSQSSRH